MMLSSKHVLLKTKAKHAHENDDYEYLVYNIESNTPLMRNINKFGIHYASHFVSINCGQDSYNIPLAQFLMGDLSHSRPIEKPKDYKYPEDPHSLIEKVY